MKRLITMACLGVVVAATVCPAFGKSLGVQMREGVYKEEMEGDLPGAIAIYEKVIQAATENRRYAAEAHYRMGLCYGKQGNKDKAAEMFSKIVNDYADQKRTAVKARKELDRYPGNAQPKVDRPADAPPIVLNTFPKALSMDVSADVSEISVTFDKAMMDGSWSWTGGGETFPKGTGKIHYDSNKATCKMPVKLESGKVYWIGINSPSHKNFKTPDRIAANRYVILFSTRSTNGQKTPIPKDMLAKAQVINKINSLNPSQFKANAPRVVKTLPAVYTNNVSVNLKTVTVKFSQGMMDGSWSWTGGGETFPETGKPYYDKTKTVCKLPVTLEAGKVYWIGINSPSYKNFKTLARVPAKRHVILFATKGEDGSPTPIPEDLLAKAKSVNKAVDNSQASAQSTVESFLNHVTSGSRKAKFFIDSGSAIIHQIDDLEEIFVYLVFAFGVVGLLIFVVSVSGRRVWLICGIFHHWCVDHAHCRYARRHTSSGILDVNNRSWCMCYGLDRLGTVSIAGKTKNAIDNSGLCGNGVFSFRGI